MIRIIRTKFLYRAATDELASGRPFAAGMTISLLQDAVEAMAHEAAARVNAQLKPHTAFLEHWDAISKTACGKRLPYKIEMTELNTARVGFKHLGVNPALSEAEKQRLAAHRFLVETARDFFSVDFDDISEANLIADSRISADLKAAESALSQPDPTKAFEYCRQALDTVEKLMAEAIVVSERDPPRPKVSPDLRSVSDGFVEWANRRFIALQKSIAFGILGMNPSDYWFLYDSLPRRTVAGGFYWPPAESIVSKITKGRAQACIRITIDLALRVERVHADMQRLAEQSGISDERRRLKEWQERLLDQQIPYELSNETKPQQ